jgi:hypothetical protein
MRIQDDLNENNEGASSVAMAAPLPAVVWPSEPWRAAFRAQATADLMARALRWAEGEAVRGRLANPALAWDPEDVVQQLLAATVGGTLRWRPDLVSLGAHLRDKIRLAGRRARRRCAVNLPRLVAALDIAEVEETDGADAEALVGDDEWRLVVRDVARRCEAQIAKLAAGDPEVLLVLSAMPEAETEAELADATGLSAAKVRAAKRRLRRLATRLAPALRADVGGILRVDLSGSGDLAHSRDE